MSEKIEIEKDELMSILYQLDWKDILQDAVEGRPNSWGYPTKPAKPDENQYPVNEWRNASDQLIAPVWKRLEKAIEQEVEEDGLTDLEKTYRRVNNDVFDFESATGIAPAVEVLEWADDSDPAVPKKIKLHHNGTDFGTFVKESEVDN